MKITDLIPWRGSAREVAPQAAPMDPMRALQLDVDRAFDHFWRMVPSPFTTLARLPQADAVRVDVHDTGTEVSVSAELPGMSDADVDVSISDGMLTIRGEKKSDRESEEDGVFVRERLYGAIERTVPLPDGVDPDAAKATFRNGVLTIAIPKSAEFQASTKRIPVQAG
ncbi:Hsp20/alpha crystallin family protein [Mesorhizobium sp. CAU 1741]|uniref:Hsp20/alpha crystallin family protein n=1 Tax=Mesorhizobium sp. CAU 1741 TaxID=3140366 RepID=UPI00325C2CEC